MLEAFYGNVRHGVAFLIMFYDVLLYGWTGPRWKGAFLLVPWAGPNFPIRTPKMDRSRKDLT